MVDIKDWEKILEKTKSNKKKGIVLFDEKKLNKKSKSLTKKPIEMDF